MRDEITVSRSEMRALAVSITVAAGFCGLGVGCLLQKLTNMSPPLISAFGLLVSAALWYPPARMLYRLRDYDLRLWRYTIVWLIVVLAVTAIRLRLW
jgi:hypothetical protein